MRYRLGDLELDRIRGELRRDGVAVPLQPKPQLLLVYLVENRERLVPASELSRVLWPDEHVGPNSLATCLGRLRKALGPSARQWVQTRSKEGLRWVGPCEELSRDLDSEAPETTLASALGGEVLAGRDGERETLLQALTRAIRGRGGFVVVSGEQGAGKTALVESILDAARSGAASCAVGQCVEEAAPPFTPWIEILRQLRAVVDRTVWERATDEETGELGILFETELDTAIADRMARDPRLHFRLADAAARIVEQAGRLSPTVVVLEDAQWADDSSLLTLKRLASRVQRAPILLLVTCRAPHAVAAGPAEIALSELGSKYGGQQIRLAGLSSAATREMAERLAGRSVATEEADRLHAATGGVPLLIEQLVEHNRRAPNAELPRAAEVVIGNRLAQLGERGGRVLELAAVLGLRIDPLDLEHMFVADHDVSPAALGAALDDAQRAGILEIAPPPSRRLQFHHGLIREVIYRGIAPERLILLHWRAGTIGEERVGATPMPLPAIAEHLVRGVAAGDPARARDACVRAAHAAAQRGAFAAAAAFWRDALNMLTREPAPEPSTAIELRIELASALFQSGQTVEAMQSAEIAIDGARQLGDPVLQARAVLSCEARIDIEGTVDEAFVQRIEDAMQRLEHGDSALRVRLLGCLARGRHHQRDGGQARRALSREAVEMAKRLRDPLVLATALEDRRMALLAPEDQDEHDAVLREIMTLASDRGDGDAVLQASLHTGWSLAVRGRMTTAARQMERCREALVHSHSPDASMQLAMWRQMRHLLAGEWDQAQRTASEIVDVWCSIDETLGPMLTINLGVADLLRGVGSVEIAGGGVALFPNRPEVRGFLLTAMLDEGRIEEAREEWQRSLAMGIDNAPSDGRWLVHTANLARIVAALGDRPRAEYIYRRLEPMAGWLAMLGPLYFAVPVGAVARPLGLLASSLGHWSDAERHFETAVAKHREWGARPSLAATLCDWAEMRAQRRRRGDRDAARAMLDEARDLAEQLEMPLVLRRCGELQ